MPRRAGPWTTRLARSVAGDLTLVETALYAVFALTIVAGLGVAAYDVALFKRLFTAEDGLVESATPVALLAGAVVCWRRAWRLRRRRGRAFIVATGLMGLALFGAAGEEISWGQRLIGVRTPAFFARHNRQRELNIHNLTLGRIRVQRVLERAAWLVALIGLVGLPPAYRRLPWVRRPVDRLGVPVPRLRHAVGNAVAPAAAFLMPGARRWEVYEFLAALLIVAIIGFPSNRAIFEVGSRPGADPPGG